MSDTANRIFCKLSAVAVTVLSIAAWGIAAQPPETEMSLPAVRPLPIEGRGDNLCWYVDCSGRGDRLKRRITFTGNDTLEVEQSMSRHYYVLKGDTIAERGHENRSIRMMYDRPVTLYAGHPSYGDSISGTYSGKGVYYSRSAVGVRGNYYTVADGRGSIVTDDRRLDGVVRLRHHREGYQLLDDDAAAVDSFMTADLSGRLPDGVVRYTHDTYLWFMPGACFPVAEAVRMVTREGDGRQYVVRSEDLINFPGDYDCQSDEGVRALAAARPGHENGDSGANPLPSVTLSDVEATLSPDGRSVTVDYTATGDGMAGAVLTFGAFDVTGRQLGRLTSCHEGAGRHTAVIQLTSLPAGQLLLSIFSDSGAPCVYKVNHQ